MSEGQTKMGDMLWRSKRMTFDSPVFPHKCAVKILCTARAILAINIIFMNGQNGFGRVFLRKRLKRFASFWYQGLLMITLKVNSPFRATPEPRGTHPSP